MLLNNIDERLVYTRCTLDSNLANNLLYGLSSIFVLSLIKAFDEFVSCSFFLSYLNTLLHSALFLVFLFQCIVNIQRVRTIRPTRQALIIYHAFGFCFIL